MNRFGPLYAEAISRRWCWRLGLQSRGVEHDTALVSACERYLREEKIQPDLFFHRHRGGRNAEGSLAEAMTDHESIESALDHSYWAEEPPESMLIDEVESIWSAIADRDDWAPLHDKVERLREAGRAHGPPPNPAGHVK